MRKKSVLWVSVGLALLVGLIGTVVVWAQSGAGSDPPYAVARALTEEEAAAGEGMGDSASDCAEYPCVVFLEPIRPGEEGWVVEPSESGDQGEAVNGIVRGPSGETEYRCVVLLEPIQPGEQFSRASEPVCSRGAIDSINGVSLDSSYLIAKFYDGTNYTNLLVEYYGASACSPTVSYGVPDLPDNLDNRFASGRAYSDCDHIHVYDFNYYGEPKYSCGANCPSFYALNDEVSSWKTND